EVEVSLDPLCACDVAQYRLPIASFRGKHRLADRLPAHDACKPLPCTEQAQASLRPILCEPERDGSKTRLRIGLELLDHERRGRAVADDEGPSKTEPSTARKDDHEP